MRRRPRPNVIYAAFSDIYSAAGILFPIVVIGFAFCAWLQDPFGSFMLEMVLAVVITIVGLSVAYYRTKMVSDTVEKGAEVMGKVTGVRLGNRRSNSEIKWEYVWEGKQYKGHGYTANNRGTPTPNVHEELPLFVNPDKPSWSVMQTLYEGLYEKPVLEKNGGNPPQDKAFKSRRDRKETNER